MTRICRMPFWQICFLVEAVIFGLQILPWTGLPLLFIGAPFWSVVTLNAGFAGMICASITRQLPPWALAFPIAWFGGYYAVLGASYYEIQTISQTFEKENALLQAVFQPEQHDLIIERVAQAAISPQVLIKDYGLEAVYLRSDAGTTCGPFKSLKIRHSSCAKPPMNRGYDLKECPLFEYPVLPLQWSVPLPPPIEGICEVEATDSPSRPSVKIDMAYRSLDWFGLESSTTEFAITQADGTIVKLRTGSATPLSVIPTPMLGCGVNAATSSWQCEALFGRQRSVSFGSSGLDDTDFIAEKLGLRKSPIVARAEAQPKTNTPGDIDK